MIEPTWVKQQHDEGCAIATLAMITGLMYRTVLETVDSWSITVRDDRTSTAAWRRGEPQDWNVTGCTHYTVDRFLAGDGWFIQRRHEGWDELPMEPFAQIHYASVKQPSGRGHFVVVLENGDVLDPLREGRHKLSDWPQVNQLVGLTR